MQRQGQQRANFMGDCGGLALRAARRRIAGSAALTGCGRSPAWLHGFERQVQTDGRRRARHSMQPGLFVRRNAACTAPRCAGSLSPAARPFCAPHRTAHHPRQIEGSPRRRALSWRRRAPTRPPEIAARPGDYFIGSGVQGRRNTGAGGPPPLLLLLRRTAQAAREKLWLAAEERTPGRVAVGPCPPSSQTRKRTSHRTSSRAARTALSGAWLEARPPAWELGGPGRWKAGRAAAAAGWRAALGELTLCNLYRRSPFSGGGARVRWTLKRTN